VTAVGRGDRFNNLSGSFCPEQLGLARWIVLLMTPRLLDSTIKVQTRGGKLRKEASMSTTRKAYLRIGRRLSKSWKPVRTLSKMTNNRAERQKNYRYHHYA
jgi:hypothetical protein